MPKKLAQTQSHRQIQELFFVTIILVLVTAVGYLIFRAATGVITTPATSAITPAGDFLGICPNQKVRDQIYVKYETYNNSVNRVEFYINNQKVRTEQLAPFALAGNAEDASQTIFPYDTTKLSDGRHQIKAIIYTGQNQYTDTLDFVVSNNNPSETQDQFLGICEGQAVTGQLYINYLTNPSDTDRVSFELRGPNNYRFAKTERVTPYGFNGNLEAIDNNNLIQILPFNSMDISTGKYSLTATKYTKSGSSIRKDISFTVDRAPALIPDAPSPTSTTDQSNICSAQGNSLDQAKANFTAECKIAYSQNAGHDCDEISSNLWLCANATITNGVISGTPTQSSLPSSSPQSETPPPSVSLPLTQVDPLSSTDNSINKLLKENLRNGNPKELVAAGTWWGPLDKFFVNQLWLINKTTQLGKVHGSTGSQTSNMACFLPGRGNNSGFSRNFLTNPVTVSHFGVRSDGLGSTRRAVSNNPNGNFINITSPIPTNYSSFELRLRCESNEGEANTFGDGSPIIGDDLNAVLGIGQWRNSVGNARDAQFNHSGLPVRYETLNARGWYQKEGYVHLSIDGGEQNHNGRTTNLSNKDLIGATIRGRLKLRGYGQKGGNIPSLGPSLNSGQMPIQHMEMRIEQNDEDYTVDRRMIHSGSGNLHRQAIEFELDTTILTEGWHIISFHTHAIDKANPAPYRDKQLAVEIKFPICIDNDNKNDCPIPSSSSNPPNNPTSNSNLITSGVSYNNDSSANISSSRNSSVRVPENLISPRQGWIAARVRMGFASNASLSRDPILFDLSQSDPRDHFVYYDIDTDRFNFARNFSSGGNTLSSSSQNFSSGSVKTIIAAWTPTELKLSIDGSAFQTRSNSSIPDQAPLYIGSTGVQGSSRQANSDYYWVAGGTGTLSNTDAQRIHSFGNTDRNRIDFPGNANFIWDATSNRFNNR